MLQSAFAAGRGRNGLVRPRKWNEWRPPTSPGGPAKMDSNFSPLAFVDRCRHSSSLFGREGRRGVCLPSPMRWACKPYDNLQSGNVYSVRRSSSQCFDSISSPFSHARLRPSNVVRWMSADGKQGNQNGGSKDGAPQDDAGGPPKEDPKAEGLHPRAFLMGTREQLRKMADLEVGDVVATYSIVLLLAAILLSPIVGQYMRRSESTYDELDTDDQVVDLAGIIRRDFLDKISDGSSLEEKGVVDSVLADVLSSKAVQEQAIKFVVGIIQSEQVKAVCQQLLKDLWNDLVKDPETTAQIIYVLNMAIQNDDIRLAVKKLVIDIVEDEEVLEELVRLLQKLGRDKQVLEAVKTLLAESAHNTLNDPEILDHSMEFATDVVGDDVVQRTAGEALRNSVSYAVQPGISMVLAAAGVGFLFFSVMSLVYAWSPETDAKVLDTALSGLAVSLLPSRRLVDRVWNVVALPFRAVGALTSALVSFLLPLQNGVRYVLAIFHHTGHALTKAAQITWTSFFEFSRASVSCLTEVAHAVASAVGTFGNAIGIAFYETLDFLSTTLGGMMSLYTSIIESTRNSWVTVQLLLASLSRTAYARAWVSLDAASLWLVTFQGWFSSLVRFIIGLDRKI